MIFIDYCDSSVDGLTKVLSSLSDVELEPLIEMLSLTKIIYDIC